MPKKPKTTTTTTSPAYPWSTSKLTPSTVALLVLSAALVRLLVSLGPYSGHQTPPKFGDYEAQRHWMEIALHTPALDWYRNTSVNDLAYWGLDYPPLSAYQSFVHGLWLNSTVPEAVALGTSRGFESYRSKLIMRWTVLLSDLVVFFPAAIYFVWVYTRRWVGGEGEKCPAPWLLAMILFNPCLMLIDHGHFQYNCICLGLTLGAIGAILSQNDMVGSVLFTLAINHKQMSLYYAPAFFSYLLGKCLRRKRPVIEVMKLGFVVLGTFALVWWPYLNSIEAIITVLSRLAPFDRGIYEDYVANYWCTTSVFIKWKRIFTMQSLKFFSLIATVIAFVPSFYHQLKSPSELGFLYSLLNTSFSFYLFSFQVHEKSILLPLLPASLLALQEPQFFGWFVYFSLVSMYPLLFRDHLLLQYGATLALFGLIMYAPDGRNGVKSKTISTRIKVLLTLPFVGSIILQLVYLHFQPPQKYPFLFEALIMFLCFSQFVILTVYANIKQFMLDSRSSLKGKKEL